MRPLSRSLLVCAFLSAVPCFGGTPYLVEDINPVPIPQDSNPAPLVSLGGVNVFLAYDERAGRELWRTDGTPAGTYRLADFCPGTCFADVWSVASTERLYFFTAVSSHTLGSRSPDPRALWVTGGDLSNTFQLATHAELSSGEGVWLPGRNLLLFNHREEEHGSELWRSDGTPAGTYQLVEMLPGRDGGGPSHFQQIEGRAFFTAATGSGHEPALWTSDGTAEGTRLVRSFPTSIEGPQYLTAVGRRLFFLAHDAASGLELWTSDGTPAGTRRVVDLSPGPSSTQFWSLDALGSRLVFTAETGDKGQELWASDGTARGTRPLTDFASATAFMIPREGDQPYEFPPTVFGNRLLFIADDGQHGREPWVTDGTRAGTFLLQDVCPGSCPSWHLSAQALAFGSRLFFTPANPTLGWELWVSDGTPAGTRIVRNICRGPCSSRPSLGGPLGGKLLFTAASEQSAVDLWSTDGTSRGTVRISNFTPEEVQVYGLSSHGQAGGSFVFSARDRLHGRELWRTDGTRTGTYRVADINTYDIGGSFPVGLQTFGDRVLFFAYEPVYGYELWESDGTAQGTSLLHELVPGEGPPFSPFSGLYLDHAVQSGQLLFFTGYGLTTGRSSLWRTDGTSGGTLQLTPEDVKLDSGIAVLHGIAYFSADDGVHGVGLWKSDGTTRGTVRVQDVGAPIGEMVIFGGKIVFAAGTEETEYTLWSSDGTAGGTTRIGGFSRRFQPSQLTEHAGQLYFFAAAEELDIELWRTNGTASGTVRVTDLTQSANSFRPNAMVSLPSGLLFSGEVSPTIHGLWISDGTTAGTRSISPQRLSSLQVPALHGRAFFVGPLEGIGVEGGLWMTDGTEGGTRPVRDRDGHFVMLPQNAVVASGRMFMVGYDGARWAVWQTDGTEAGLSRLADFGDYQWSRQPAVAGSRFFFQCRDGEHGSELCAVPIQ